MNLPKLCTMKDRKNGEAAEVIVLDFIAGVPFPLAIVQYTSDGIIEAVSMNSVVFKNSVTHEEPAIHSITENY